MVVQVNAPKGIFDTDDEDNMSDLESEEEVEDNDSNNAKKCLQPSATSSESEVTFPKGKSTTILQMIKR